MFSNDAKEEIDAEEDPLLTAAPSTVNVARMCKFLTHPNFAASSMEKRINFLKNKGCSPADIREATSRVEREKTAAALEEIAAVHEALEDSEAAAPALARTTPRRQPSRSPHLPQQMAPLTIVLITTVTLLSAIVLLCFILYLAGVLPAVGLLWFKRYDDDDDDDDGSVYDMGYTFSYSFDYKPA